MSYPKEWTCPVCGVVYVVPSLARICAAKHKREQENR